MARNYIVVSLALILFVAAFLVGSNISKAKYEELPIDNVLFDSEGLLVESEKLLYQVDKNTKVDFSNEIEKDLLIMHDDVPIKIIIADRNAREFNLQYAMAYNAVPKK